MKLITPLIIVFLSTTSLLGQVVEFDPEISNFPDLSPDTLKKYEALGEEYHYIIDNEISYESLTEKQKWLFENELLFEAGPYFTGELGCSWYCATGPSGLFAKSELDSSKIANYKPENAHDFDLRTAWVEGKPDYGIGEEIEIRFKLFADLKVTHIDIFNGYCKSEKTWKDNSRVKTFALSANGQFVGSLNLKDTYKRQRFKIGSFGGGNDGNLILTLRIMEVYKGEKYSDTAISEINFDGTGDH